MKKRFRQETPPNEEIIHNKPLNLPKMKDGWINRLFSGIKQRIVPSQSERRNNKIANDVSIARIGSGVNLLRKNSLETPIYSNRILPDDIPTPRPIPTEAVATAQMVPVNPVIKIPIEINCRPDYFSPSLRGRLSNRITPHAKERPPTPEMALQLAAAVAAAAAVAEDEKEEIDSRGSSPPLIEENLLREEFLPSSSEKIPASKNEVITINDDFTIYLKCIFHDLRIPLNNISMGIDIISSFMTNENEAQREIVMQLKESCDFINDILDGFLHINKNSEIDINNLAICLKPFNVVGLIKKVQYLLNFKILNKKININYNINPSIFEWVIGDDIKLQHVLLNLLSNAIKFSHEESAIYMNMDGKIMNNGKQLITIIVKDENEYINKNIKEKLFQKFNTSDTKNGSGLGLYISRQIVEKHGGKIKHYYNKTKKGNIFKIDIELDVCASTTNLSSAKLKSLMNESGKNASGKTNKSEIINRETIKSDSCQSVIPTPPPQKTTLSRFLQNNCDSIDATLESRISHYYQVNSKSLNMHSASESYIEDTSFSVVPITPLKELPIRILLADDTEVSIKLLKRILLLNDPTFRIDEASDGLEGFMKINTNVYDVIFTDNIMPKITGSLMTKLLRTIGYNKIIIGITGNGTEDEIEDFYNNGVDYVFIKPLTREKLNMIIAFLKGEKFHRQEGKRIILRDSELTWE